MKSKKCQKKSLKWTPNTKLLIFIMSVLTLYSCYSVRCSVAKISVQYFIVFLQCRFCAVRLFLQYRYSDAATVSIYIN